MANSVNTDLKLKSPPLPTPHERVLSEFSKTNHKIICVNRKDCRIVKVFDKSNNNSANICSSKILIL